MDTPGRHGRAPLTVGVIGPGRVGTVLGAALAAAGHRVAAVTATDSRRAPALLPGAAVRSPSEVADAATDLLLVTVPDDALAATATALRGRLRPEQVVAHTSGAYGVTVLAPAGGRPLALHPAMTFTGSGTDLDRLPGTSYGVTADPALRPFATRLVADLGGTVEWVAEADRPLYHAALAHGANHLVTLVSEAAELLHRAGVTDPARLLAPLLRAALTGALAYGDAALTGPVARGDAGTIARHLRVLARAAPGAAPAYRALAARTTDRAVTAGRLSGTAAAALRTALAVPDGAAV